eukprot:2374174-Alexandrium_andersonii.AAC.1
MCIRDRASPASCRVLTPGCAVGADELARGTAVFSGGLNAGFYINSYTTKQCPTMSRGAVAGPWAAAETAWGRAE